MISTIFENIKGFLKSVKILLFNDITKPAFFTGYNNEWFANIYRMKRQICWRKKWDQLGKEQFILKFLPGKLIVCSKLELKAYQKIGLIDKNLSIRKITNKSL